MISLRVSSTDIDQLKYFRETDDMELADIIARLKHLMPSNEVMEAGSALHSALEAADEGEFVGFARDGFTFSFETEAAIDLPAIREMKATREYRIDGVAVTLVGKVDAVHGRTVYDHKLTAQFDAERYLGSFQWRGYLEIFDADTFQWNVFEAAESAPRNYLIRKVHQLTQHRYPGMAEDVERELREFVSFARHHLPERFMLEAA